MKSTLIISLLITLTIPLMVTNGFLYLQKRMIKYEVKKKILKGIPENELIVFTVTNDKNKFSKWLKEGEFEYEDGLYDVVKVKYESDCVVYFTIKDDEESQINSNIKTLCDDAYNQKPNTKDQQKKLIEFYKLLLAYPQIAELICSASSMIPSEKTGNKDENVVLADYSSQINHPPESTRQIL